MLGVVIALLVVLVAAAVVGVVITSLFWLSLVALGGILLTGAVGVSVLGARAPDDADDEPRPAVGRSHLRLAASGPARRGAAPSRDTSQGGGAQDGGDVRRAA